MNALIDSDFQRLVDAMNDSTPPKDTSNRFDHNEFCGMDHGFGFEAMAGGFGDVGVDGNWHFGAPNAEQAFDRMENRDSEVSHAAESSDLVQAIREDLSRIEAELRELKRTVETTLEIYGQRVTNTEKYIDELLPWTAEVHGAIEHLTGRVAEEGKACQDGLSAAQDGTEKD